MATPDWIDVAARATGTDGDGHLTGWETAGFAANTVYYFKQGNYALTSTLTFSNAGVHWIGDGITATNIHIKGSMGSSVAIKADTGSDGLHLEGMDIHVDVSTSAGQVSLQINSQLADISRIRLMGARVALKLTSSSSGWFDRIDINCSVAGGCGIHIVDTKGAFFTRINIPMYANATSIYIKANSLGSPDTIHFTDLGMSAFTGSTNYTALLITGATNSYGEWLKFTNCAIESPVGDAAETPTWSTSPTVDIRTGRSVTFVNCVITGGQNVVKIASVVSSANPTGVRFVGCTLAGSARACVYHHADVPTQLVGCIVGNGSREQSNTYSGVFLTTSSKKFAMIGGSSGNGVIAGSPAKLQKYGIENGSDDYLVSDVDLSNNATGPSSGLNSVTIASAATIAPPIRVVHVSGSTTIKNITRPNFCGDQISVTLIPIGNWSTCTSGNIAVATTAVLYRALTMYWIDSSQKWYPSYV